MEVLIFGFIFDVFIIGKNPRFVVFCWWYNLLAMERLFLMIFLNGFDSTCFVVRLWFWFILCGFCSWLWWLNSRLYLKMTEIPDFGSVVMGNWLVAGIFLWFGETGSVSWDILLLNDSFSRMNPNDIIN